MGIDLGRTAEQTAIPGPVPMVVPFPGVARVVQPAGNRTVKIVATPGVLTALTVPGGPRRVA